MRIALFLLLMLSACGGAEPSGPADPTGGDPTDNGGGAATSGTIPDQTLSTAGGTITVSRPGTPLDGMTIRLPANAFPAPLTIGISYAPAGNFPGPSGSTVISPLLTFRTSDGGLATSPMLLTVPVTVPAGSFPAMILRDAATGRQEVLTTVAYTATSITVMTGHLNGRRLMGSDGSFAPSGGATLRDPAATGTAAVIALPEALLAQDHDTGFRPGVDSWEFRPVGTIVSSEPSAAIAATAAWYYVAKKATNGKLWKKYQEAEGIELSNRRGLRWTSLAAQIFGGTGSDVTSVLNLLAGTPIPGGPDLNAKVTSSSFNSLRSALTLSPGSPQVAFLLAENKNDGGVEVVVYRSTNQTLYAVDPGAPSEAVQLTFTANGMTPVTLTGSSLQYTGIFATGFSLLSSVQELQTQWPKVADGTIGNDVFPTFRAKAAWGIAPADQADLTNPLYAFGAEHPTAVWVDCVSCTGAARPPTLPPGTASIASLTSVRATQAAGPWQTLGDGPGVNHVTPTAGTQPYGLVVFTLEPNGTDWAWTDWVGYHVTRLPAEITLSSTSNTTGSEVSLTLAVTGAPANLEYEWDFADGPKVVTNTLATKHIWATAGDKAVNVTARDRTTKQPVARAAVTATITEPKQAWRLVSLTKVNEVGNVNPSNPEAFWAGFPNPNVFAGDYTRNRTLMTALLANPAEAVVYRYTGSSNFVIYLKRVSVGVVPNLAVGGDVILASSCGGAVTCTSYNGLTFLGDNVSGSIDGKHVHSAFFGLKNQDGITLTGTFRVGEGHLPPLPYPVHYVDYSFTAVRVP